jgi:hypothetical protein
MSELNVVRPALYLICLRYLAEHSEVVGLFSQL